MEGVSVFIPAYNEEKILKKNILEIYSFMLGFKDSFELTIIDDASTDSTVNIGRYLSESYREINYVRYDDGPTYRGNLFHTMPEAKHEFIVYMDADLSTPLRFLPPLIKHLQEGYDIVVGSRHLPQSSVERGFKRHMASLLFKFFMRAYFQSEIRDHACGFKAFRKEKLLPLLAEMSYGGSLPRKMFYDSELLLRAQDKGYKIKEMPIVWREAEDSKITLLDQLLFLPYALTLRFRL